MRLSGILKPEYFYQPKVALQRMLRFQSRSNSEFVEHKLPWGMDIRVRPQEEHGEILSTLGVIDLAVTEVLWRLTEPGELVVDIGANIGYMTAVFAARVGMIAGGSIWSFEAHPEIFEELNYNINKWQKQLLNIQFNLENVAVSEVGGMVKLAIPEFFSKNRGLASVVTNNDSIQEVNPSESNHIIVKASNLDMIFPTQKIGVLKIDVEGHELSVIKGAISLLTSRRIRDCVFEEHLHYPTPVTNFLEKMGYRIFRIQRSFKKPVLLEPNSKITRTHWQPTSFIATVNPDRVISAFQQPGWQTLEWRKNSNNT